MTWSFTKTSRNTKNVEWVVLNCALKCPRNDSAALIVLCCLMRFKPTFLEGIASEILHSFQINSLHILNSHDLPAGQTLCNCLLYQKDTRNGAQRVFQPFASFIITRLVITWSLPGKSALLNDRIVRSFDLCFSALS